MSNDNVIGATFNDGQRRDDEMFGPRLDPSWHKVIIDGRLIPSFLVRDKGEQVEVMFDNRWIYEYPERWIARIALSMAAEAYAVGRGYSHLGATDRNLPFAPKVVIIEEGL